MDKLIQNILDELRSYSNEKRLTFAKTSHPTQMELIGVASKELKIVLKSLRSATKHFNDNNRLILIKKMIHLHIFEMQQLAFEYFQSYKKLHQNLTLEFLNEIEINMDNWVSVDYYSTIVLGCAWRTGIVSSDYLLNYMNSEDHWKRRIAVVSTIALNQKSKGGKGDSVRTLKICTAALLDHHPMVVKAMSWALRELAKIEPDSVKNFIEKHIEILHPKIIREVNNKLTNGLKNGVK